MNKCFNLKLAKILLFFSLICIQETFADNRIISLIPSSTELICALGFDKELIAVSDYCNYPKNAISNLPRIGDQNLNIEKILSLNPSILIDTNSIHQRYKDLFSKLKLKYYNITINTVNDIPVASKKLARELGNEDKATHFIDEWQKEISNLSLLKSDIAPKIYVEIWNNPIQAAGENTSIDSIITASGGRNALTNHKAFPIINSETVLLTNPDIILLLYPEADKNEVKQRPGWKNLKAVINDNIYKIDQDLIIRPGPRNIQAIKKINTIINKGGKQL